MAKQQVCAIVPAFEEAARISTVLQALQKATLVDEIIVVDDGSRDQTEACVRGFPSVRYFHNPVNAGKAYSMCVAADQTRANILFFCDADLKGFTARHVDTTIRPVLAGRYEMFILSRWRINNRSTLWSGQRALTRALWDRVPSFYKKGFRIELGLNFFCRNYGYTVMPYSQYIKEKKFGWFWGLYKRFFMISHLVMALLHYLLIDLDKARTAKRSTGPEEQSQGKPSGA